jgi:hypothetical protein
MTSGTIRSRSSCSCCRSIIFSLSYLLRRGRWVVTSSGALHLVALGIWYCSQSTAWWSAADQNGWKPSSMCGWGCMRSKDNPHPPPLRREGGGGSSSWQGMVMVMHVPSLHHAP